MSLVLALGSNIGNSIANLHKATQLLQQHFTLVQASRIYRSEPVDYLDQPIFFNQVLEFKMTNHTPLELLVITQHIEQLCGGHLDINKGPRYLDVDILFIGDKIVNLNNLVIPHPKISQRSFVLLPLSELPFYSSIDHQFPIPDQFSSWAFPIDPTP